MDLILNPEPDPSPTFNFEAQFRPDSQICGAISRYAQLSVLVTQKSEQ